MVVAELKQDGQYPTEAQQAWLDDFARMPGIEAYVWRPKDWDEIARILSKKTLDI